MTTHDGHVSAHVISAAWAEDMYVDGANRAPFDRDHDHRGEFRKYIARVEHDAAVKALNGLIEALTKSVNDIQASESPNQTGALWTRDLALIQRDAQGRETARVEEVSVPSSDERPDEVEAAICAAASALSRSELSEDDEGCQGVGIAGHGHRMKAHVEGWFDLGAVVGAALAAARAVREGSPDAH